MPTRIDRTLFEAAKAAGSVHSRSAAQQLSHWARIGKELESSPAVTHGEIDRTLTGGARYDALTEREQAVVRADWDELIAERIAGLDLEDRLRESGHAWVEADHDGNVVQRGRSRPVV